MRLQIRVTIWTIDPWKRNSSSSNNTSDQSKWCSHSRYKCRRHNRTSHSCPTINTIGCHLMEGSTSRRCRHHPVVPVHVFIRKIIAMISILRWGLSIPITISVICVLVRHHRRRHHKQHSKCIRDSADNNGRTNQRGLSSVSNVCDIRSAIRNRYGDCS